MKALIKSKLIMTLTAFVLIAAAIAVPISRNGNHSHAAPLSSQDSWQVVANPNQNNHNSFNLNSIAAVSANDVWAVGQSYPGSPQTLVMHWDGSSWTTVSSPNPTGYDFLTSVAAVSANDVWAVGWSLNNDYSGYNTITMHWDGSSWKTITSPNPTQYSELTSVTAVSSNDVWAVGFSFGNGIQTITMHWDGSSWTTIISPNLSSNNYLTSVAAVSSNDVWAAGYTYSGSTLTMHWDGSSWTIITSPNPTSYNVLNSITAVSSNDIWAAGYTMADPNTGITQTLIMHWELVNGTYQWVTKPSPNPATYYNSLTSVAAVSANDVWSVGWTYGGSSYNTLTMHWDGSSWTTITSPNLSSHNFLTSVTVISANDIWSVGYTDIGVLTEQYTQSPTLNINVTVSTPGGHFISSYIQDNASLPLHIHVAYSDGSPVGGAQVRLSNPNGFLAVFNPITDSNGNLDAPLPLPPSPLSPQPLTAGDFVSEVIATVNGKDYSSGLLTLYHADLVGSYIGSLTQAEADNYSWNLLYAYVTRPGIPRICPGGNPGISGICTVLKVLDLFAKVALANNSYSPKAGDSWKVQVYKYSAPTMAPVYLYNESVDRNGSNIYNYARWTEDITQVQPWLNSPGIARTALVTKFASPVTVLAVSPNGQRAGFDPSTHNYVFDFPAAISNAGDEPYELVIPSPVQGQYTYQVTGTGNGTYAMTVQSLDSAGNGNPVTTISGIAAPGITDTYVLTYPASAGRPVIIVRKITIDIKPGQDPPAINPGSNGVTPVAILSTPTFNATTVDASSVKFGPNGASPVHTSIQDVNGDGIPDLILQFNTTQTGIVAGNTQACLTGNTTSGLSIMGCDTIQTVPH
jgi:hypothetical protein